MPGRIPSVISGNWKEAFLLATMLWQRIAISNPPPKARPFTAATTGFCMVSMYTNRLEQSRANAAEAPAFPSISGNLPISAPAQNARSPYPVITNPLMALFATSSWMADKISLFTSSLRAFINWGLLMVMIFTPSMTSIRMWRRKFWYVVNGFMGPGNPGRSFWKVSIMRLVSDSPRSLMTSKGPFLNPSAIWHPKLRSPGVPIPRFRISNDWDKRMPKSRSLIFLLVAWGTSRGSPMLMVFQRSTELNTFAGR